MGRFLLDAFSKTILSSVFFIIRFFVWTLQWSFAVVLFLLVMAGTGYYVYNVTLKGRAHVVVPNIVDRPISEAAFLLSEKHLEIGKQVQATHPSIPKYYVIAQRPAAGRVARESRRVNVIVSMGEDYMRAPDLTGKNLEEARREILASRFRVGSLARIPEEQPRDTVLSQDPPAGARLPEQGEIHLLVSAGSGRPSALMPDLRGLAISDIARAMEGFDVVLVANAVDIPGAVPDIVLAQSPPPDTLIYQNQVVTYDYLRSSGEKAPTQQYEDTVRHQMFYDWYSRDVRVDVVDRLGNRQTIWTKKPLFDEEALRTYVTGTVIRVPVTYIDEVSVEVYIDNELEASYTLKEGRPPVKIR
ncbi:MAG TPA: PASTA domain-containing protein [Candidatus Hydrogenedentes bacterium]|nr:MAG: Serine/threonine-protein kinase PknB [Candidatus Hydrogenedentes bacterium ADurb.Bin170]HOD95153.1 PASTA domain-containing protein [Candidatus Hydrogenedentota bacterium]HOM48219.1 PASTA domain-containing protein [Candidatus Hydrogenedentota bacterium]HOR50584.1 PASTA domain-containing protein [Candidatus Hydrogenedentota bacterium]HPK24799.1 PASTA domain-containing protein [Candidatus Hydrogenedentota bacterium]